MQRYGGICRWASLPPSGGFAVLYSFLRFPSLSLSVSYRNRSVCLSGCLWARCLLPFLLSDRFNRVLCDSFLLHRRTSEKISAGFPGFDSIFRLSVCLFGSISGLDRARSLPNCLVLEAQGPALFSYIIACICCTLGLQLSFSERLPSPLSLCPLSGLRLSVRPASLFFC